LFLLALGSLLRKTQFSKTQEASCICAEWGEGPGLEKAWWPHCFAQCCRWAGFNAECLPSAEYKDGHTFTIGISSNTSTVGWMLLIFQMLD
jgi:hypothetical protein